MGDGEISRWWQQCNKNGTYVVTSSEMQFNYFTDFLEPPPQLLLEGQQRKERARRFWPDPRTLPKSNRCNQKQFLFGTRCTVCGYYGHEREECRRDQRFMTCQYSLCRSTGVHEIHTCPVLYELCAKCGLRGHAEHHHRRYEGPLKYLILLLLK
jgi:hypothetical protein